MPTFERLTAEQLSERSPAGWIRKDYRDFVLDNLVRGNFVVLSPVQRVIFEFHYLTDTYYTAAEIGRLFDPPRSAGTIQGYIANGLNKLERVSLYGLPWIDAVGLTTRTRNAIHRYFKTDKVTPDELLAMSEGEMLGMRNFGEKCYAELQEKLTVHLQSN